MLYEDFFLTDEGLLEKIAKYLACIVENGEPYSNFENMVWSEFAGGEDSARVFREEATEILKFASPLIEIRKDTEWQKKLEEIEKTERERIFKRIKILMRRNFACPYLHDIRLADQNCTSHIDCDDCVADWFIDALKGVK